jgi:uncharacterized PurR-regulated membrane protein YhhQ (DUF165 family)
MIKKIKNEWLELRELIAKINPLVMTFFVLSVVLMNLLANKSIDLSWVPGNNGSYPWLALDCGLFVSWLAFFSMDNIVRRFGPKASTKMTLVAVFINLVVCGVLLFAGTVSGEWGASYEFTGQINEALDSTIAGTWYILLGSTIAFIMSAVVHGITSFTISKLFKDKESLKTYAICSSVATSLGQFVDNFLFAFIVSRVFFGWNILQCIMCSVSGMIVEFLLSFVFVPLGHKIYKNDMKRYSDD